MPRLSWNEIQNRADQFVATWQGETHERGESQSFWRDFLSIYGIDRRRQGAFFEYAVRKTGKRQGFADLYDPLTMPPELTKAHQALDRAVDRLYREWPFVSDKERLELLFEQYQELVATE